jgi:hypothetical protein
LLAAAIIASGAWAGILPFVGPLFGFSPANTSAWHWDNTWAVLDLLPGALAVLGGLVLLSTLAALAHGRGRALAGFGALLAVIAGTWLVLGPSIYQAVTGASLNMPQTGTWWAFALAAGYRLGPGLLLVAFGAWIWGMLPHSAMRRHLVTD